MSHAEQRGNTFGLSPAIVATACVLKATSSSVLFFAGSDPSEHLAAKKVGASCDHSSSGRSPNALATTYLSAGL